MNEKEDEIQSLTHRLAMYEDKMMELKPAMDRLMQTWNDSVRKKKKK
jgi:hypothetical protein